jgi:hypothetical protein
MKILRNSFFLLFVVLLFNSMPTKNVEAAECTVTAGVYSEAEIKGGCEAEPDSYEVIIYEMYLCTNLPLIPSTTTEADLSNCSQVFENTAGATATVTGLDPIDLTGSYFKPPPGIYTYGYARMDNTFTLKASIKIDGAMDGMSSGSGVFCGTAAGSGNHAQASSHSNSSVCGAAAITAGEFTETLTHFSSSGNPWDRVADAIDINNTSASIKGILVDTNRHLALNEGEVVRLEGLVKFADPVKITDATSALTMSFNLGEAMYLDEGGADEIYIGSGPFQAIMTAN